MPQFHLSTEQQSRIASQLALAEEKLDDLPSPRRYYHLAVNLEPARSRRASLEHSRAAVDAKIAVRKRNAERRPQIHRELEQDHIVKPRLTAQTSSPPAATVPRESHP